MMPTKSRMLAMSRDEDFWVLRLWERPPSPCRWPCVRRGELLHSPEESNANSPRESTQRIHPENPPRESTQRIHPENPPRESTQRIHPENPPRESTQRIHPENPPR